MMKATRRRRYAREVQVAGALHLGGARLQEAWLSLRGAAVNWRKAHENGTPNIDRRGALPCRGTRACLMCDLIIPAALLWALVLPQSAAANHCLEASRKYEARYEQLDAERERAMARDDTRAACKALRGMIQVREKESRLLTEDCFHENRLSRETVALTVPTLRYLYDLSCY